MSRLRILLTIRRIPVRWATLLVVALTAFGNARAARADAPPTGVILFSQCGPSFGTGTISRIDPDGMNMRAVAVGDEPRLSPDGTRVASTTSLGSVRTIRMDGTDPHAFAPLSPDETVGYQVAWSPDSKRIAFVATDAAVGSTQNQIYVVNDALGAVPAGTPISPAGDPPAIDGTSLDWHGANWLFTRISKGSPGVFVAGVATAPVISGAATDIYVPLDTDGNQVGSVGIVRYRPDGTPSWSGFDAAGGGLFVDGTFWLNVPLLSQFAYSPDGTYLVGQVFTTGGRSMLNIYSFSGSFIRTVGAESSYCGVDWGVAQMPASLTANADLSAVKHSGSYIREGDTVAFEGKNFDPAAGDIDIFWNDQKMTTVPAAANFKGTFQAPPFPPFTTSDKLAHKTPCTAQVSAVHHDASVSVDVSGRSTETVLYADNVFYKDMTAISATEQSVLCEGAVPYDHLGHPLLEHTVTGDGGGTFSGTEGVLVTEGIGRNNVGRPTDDGPNRDLLNTGYDGLFVQTGFADGTAVSIYGLVTAQVFVGETLVFDCDKTVFDFCKNVPPGFSPNPTPIRGPLEKGIVPSHGGAFSLAAQAIQFLPATLPADDLDFDGFENAVDGGQQGATFVPQSAQFSIDFSNSPLGGNAFGEILARDGVSLHFAGDAQQATITSPHVVPTSTNRPHVASVQVCNAFTVDHIAPSVRANVQCVAPPAATRRAGRAAGAAPAAESQILTVDAGDAAIAFGVGTTMTVPAGAKVEVTSLLPDSLQVTNLADSTADVTIVDNGTDIPLAPGQSAERTVAVDRDADGVADADDGCPDDPGKSAPGLCGCGVADTDLDGDGVLDCLDACPLDPNRTAMGPCACSAIDPTCTTLDHFVAYAVKASKGTPTFVPIGPVTLADRFGAGGYDVAKGGALLLPASENGGDVTDDVTHLLEYAVKPSKGSAKLAPPAGVHVKNECSDVVVDVQKPQSLLVPTAKSLSGPVDPPLASNIDVDHFLCYGAKPETKTPKGTQVEVGDQFQSRRYDLVKITKLCVPAAKSGAPIFLKGPPKGAPATIAPASVRHPDAVLECWRAKLATSTIPQLGCGAADPKSKGTKIAPKQPPHTPQRGMFVANQLGALRLDSVKELELCIPSLAPGSPPARP